jgi:dienelactone hydrolase
MTEMILFHHALGLTPGVQSFADELRAAGHTVHTPDLYEGKTFDTVADGVNHAREVGFQTILDRGVAAGEALPSEVAHAGFSLGVMPAQMLAQTRPGAKGAVLMYAAMPASEFGGAWPDGVPLQIHMKESDPEVTEGGDLDAARELVDTVEGAELFLYPGDTHLFAEPGFSDYDEQAANLMKKRVVEFLDTID